MGRLVGVVSAALVLAVGTASGAAEWETTRRTVIDPLNTAIHRHLPQAIKKRDLDGILALYATEVGDGLTWTGGVPVYPEGEETVVRWSGPGGPETIAARYRALLELRLVGTRSNRDAIGARIRLGTARDWQTREVHEGAGYLSGQSLVQHFGLGPATRVDEARIAWPSGAETVLTDLTTDRRYEVVEGLETAALAR